MATIHQLQPAQPTDKTFFTKPQLRVGMSLRYYGRNATRGRLWFIRQITTKGKVNGQPYTASVMSPHRLADTIVLVCALTHRVRKLTFNYLSYSAIWRLED